MLLAQLGYSHVISLFNYKFAFGTIYMRLENNFEAKCIL